MGGVPTDRTVLIEGGRLQTYLHNTYAAKDGIISTGNASALLIGDTGNGPSNLYLKRWSARRITQDISQGFYLLEVWVCTLIPSQGFSVGAAGLD